MLTGLDRHGRVDVASCHRRHLHTIASETEKRPNHLDVYHVDHTSALSSMQMPPSASASAVETMAVDMSKAEEMDRIGTDVAGS